MSEFSLSSSGSGSGGSTVASPRTYFEHFFRIVCFGQDLLDAFTAGRCEIDDSTDSAPTDVVYRVVTLPLDGSIIRVQLLGLGGETRFRPLNAQYFRAAHGVVLSYDAAEEDSIAYLQTTLREISSNSSKSLVKALVSYNSGVPLKNVMEAVVTLMGEEKALHFETSSQDRSSVDLPFQEVLRAILLLKLGGGAIVSYSPEGSLQGVSAPQQRSGSAISKKVRDWLRSPKPKRRGESPLAVSSTSTSPVSFSPQVSPVASPVSSPRPPGSPKVPSSSTNVEVKSVPTEPSLVSNRPPQRHNLFRHPPSEPVVDPTVAVPSSPLSISPSASPLSTSPTSSGPTEDAQDPNVFAKMRERDAIKRQERGERLMMVGLQRTISMQNAPKLGSDGSAAASSTPTTFQAPSEAQAPQAMSPSSSPQPTPISSSPTPLSSETTLPTPTTSSTSETQSIKGVGPREMPSFQEDVDPLDLIDAIIAGTVDFGISTTLASPPPPLPDDASFR